MRLPVILFLAALLIDHLLTQRGIAAGHSEGNIVILWLWDVVPVGHHTLALLWALLAVVVSYIVSYFSANIARWLLYTAFISHTIGLLSWTPLLGDSVQLIMQSLGKQWGLVLLFLCAAGLGAIFTFVHDRWETAMLW